MLQKGEKNFSNLFFSIKNIYYSLKKFYKDRLKKKKKKVDFDNILSNKIIDILVTSLFEKSDERNTISNQAKAKATFSYFETFWKIFDCHDLGQFKKFCLSKINYSILRCFGDYIKVIYSIYYNQNLNYFIFRSKTQKIIP
jgi:hypothetical protein